MLPQGDLGVMVGARGEKDARCPFHVNLESNGWVLLGEGAEEWRAEEEGAIVGQKGDCSHPSPSISASKLNRKLCGVSYAAGFFGLSRKTDNVG